MTGEPVYVDVKIRPSSYVVGFFGMIGTLVLACVVVTFIGLAMAIAISHPDEFLYLMLGAVGLLVFVQGTIALAEIVEETRQERKNGKMPPEPA